MMRKCFKKTRITNGKKKGTAMLICMAVFMMSCAMLSGCSMAEEDTGSEDAIEEDTENVSGGGETEEDQTEQAPADDHSDSGDILEETVMLTFMKGGEQEQKKAVLTSGDGYYIYLPENEWQPSGSDSWTASVNEQVQLWISRFEGESMNSVNQKLENDGYEAEQGFHKWKQEGDIIYHVELKEAENDVWGVFYCYPADAEEGWGREVPVIAETFAVSAGAGNADNSGADNEGGYLEDGDCLEIKNTVNEFAAAYFANDADTVRKYLASTFEGEVDTYEGTGTISDLTVKGLSDTDGKKIENERCTVSLEFRDSSYEDMFLYLTFVFIRQEDGWKIEFYGLEG